MLTQTITDPRAWRADSLDAPESWRVPLAPRLLAALQRALDGGDPTGPVTALRLEDGPERDEVRPLLAALEQGRGFVIVQGPPAGRVSAVQRQALYWLLGQWLGRPIEQNVQGTLLYDVRDTGQDVRYGARFSVTNADSSFHTDNSFGAEVADYVGLLCLQGARSGGVNQVVSAYAVHNRLRERHPDVLATLYEPFHVDRRGGVRPGEAPTVPVPVFEADGRELLCRYLRYWIEVGHDKAGAPLTERQRHALDTLDAVAADPALWAQFTLGPGEMLFLNNRWTLHNRTAFEDHDEPERRRHLVRLWLRRGGDA